MLGRPAAQQQKLDRRHGWLPSGVIHTKIVNENLESRESRVLDDFCMSATFGVFGASQRPCLR
jgi:hypothetical protein